MTVQISDENIESAKMAKYVCNNKEIMNFQLIILFNSIWEPDIFPFSPIHAC